MSGFGLSFPKREGVVVHPDDFLSKEEISDYEYKSQLQEYAKGLSISVHDLIKIYGCSRPHLFEVDDEDDAL